MRHPIFKMRIQRPIDSASSSHEWMAISEGDLVRVTLPDGARLHIPRNEDSLVTLNELAVAVPGIDSVAMRQRVEIDCSPSVEAVLPLWLNPLDDEAAGSSDDDECLAEIEDRVSWANYSADHYIFVNNHQWAVISATRGSGEAAWAAVPIRGNWYHEWFEIPYASFGFTETASMTSGWDSSSCGLITNRVFASVDRFDEGETYVSIRAATDPASDIHHWIWSSEIADQFRETWAIPDGDDDFIEWGFLQLAKTGEVEIELRGLDPSLGGDMLGVGLTGSSEWTFRCHQPPEVLRAALGEIADRRPGGVRERAPRILEGSFCEQLEQAQLLSEEELVEEGWIPSVLVDREMGIKIFNALVEPEVDPESVGAEWPSSWDPRIAPLWTRLGGTVEAASAWATAGWDYRDVLSLPRLSRYWNPPMTERLQLSTVPPVSGLDAPIGGERSWPLGDHTIVEFLKVFGQ